MCRLVLPCDPHFLSHVALQAEVVQRQRRGWEARRHVRGRGDAFIRVSGWDESYGAAACDGSLKGDAGCLVRLSCHMMRVQAIKCYS